MPKKTGDVLNRIERDYCIKFESSAVSQALLDVVKEGQLKKGKIELRNYHYYK